MATTNPYGTMPDPYGTNGKTPALNNPATPVTGGVMPKPVQTTPVTGGVMPKPVKDPLWPTTPQTGGTYPQPATGGPKPNQLWPKNPSTGGPTKPGTSPGQPGFVNGRGPALNNPGTGGVTPLPYGTDGKAPALNNATNVAGLYQQGLGREGEEAGLKFWNDKFMADGQISAAERAEFMSAAQDEIAKRGSPASLQDEYTTAWGEGNAPSPTKRNQQWQLAAPGRGITTNVDGSVHYMQDGKEVNDPFNPKVMNPLQAPERTAPWLNPTPNKMAKIGPNGESWGATDPEFYGFHRTGDGWIGPNGETFASDGGLGGVGPGAPGDPIVGPDGTQYGFGKDQNGYTQDYLKVNDMYRSALGRDGDKAGMKHWVQKFMADGTISDDEREEFLAAARAEQRNPLMQNR